jgi:heme oxygenase (biliverdin-IX-beta and delta-forming)
MIAEQLKEYTAANHQQLEKMLVKQMKAVRSADDYVSLLQVFYSYFGGLEEQIKLHIGLTELPDHASRRKSDALAADISSLGGTPAEKATAQALPQIDNALQAFGALYVIEGSTLGGKIISKMMAQQLGITDNKGLSFFKGYGDQTDAMWDAFKQNLNKYVKSEGEAAEVIEAANQTFLKFADWFTGFKSAV